MQIDIYDTQYHIPTSGNSYCSLFVRHGENPNAVVPKGEMEKLGKLTFSHTIDLSPDDSRVALDSKVAVSELNDKGYYIACAKIETTIYTG